MKKIGSKPHLLVPSTQILSNNLNHVKKLVVQNLTQDGTLGQDDPPRVQTVFHITEKPHVLNNIFPT